MVGPANRAGQSAGSNRLIKDGATFTEVKKWIDSNKAATA